MSEVEAAKQAIVDSLWRGIANKYQCSPIVAKGAAEAEVSRMERLIRAIICEESTPPTKDKRE